MLGRSCMLLEMTWEVYDMLKVTKDLLVISQNRYSVCTYQPEGGNTLQATRASARKPNAQAAAAPEAAQRVRSKQHIGTKIPDSSPFPIQSASRASPADARRVTLYRSDASLFSRSPSRARCTPTHRTRQGRLMRLTHPTIQHKALHCTRERSASKC